MITTLFTLIAAVSCINYTDCSSGKGVLKINTLTISPDPISKSKPVNYNMSFTVTTPITNATCKATIMKGVLPLVRKTFNICDELTCPIEAKTYSDSGSVDVPSEVPTGSFTLEIHCTDTSSTEIICYKASADVVALRKD